MAVSNRARLLYSVFGLNRGMNEIRRDYLLDRLVIVAQNRSKRPSDFMQEPPKYGETGECKFCPGNEKLTPPETGRIEVNGSWAVRSFYNMFAAVSMDDECARGSHEVIVETPEHEKQMCDLSIEQIGRVIDLYAERTRKLEKLEAVKFVSIFKNQGALAGTSILHSHSQLITLPTVPPLIEQEVCEFGKRKAEGRKCVFCEISENEAAGPRFVCGDDGFVAFAPYASRAAYEMWIVPKRHVRKTYELKEDEVLSLARCLKKTLFALKRLFKHPSYNYYLHTAPAGDDFHFHIEITPRLTTWAGFELGTGAYINPVPPEQAAAALRGATYVI